MTLHSKSCESYESNLSRLSGAVLRFTLLGSGSAGNCLVINSGASTVLVDCGLSFQETKRRLFARDIGLTDIDAILVTHEHGDHCGGVFTLANKMGLPIWCTTGTSRATSAIEQSNSVNEIIGFEKFEVGALKIVPYPVPHDALEPSQFTLSDSQFKLGVLTDAGAVTAHMFDNLHDCDALVLEFNHDEDLLLNSSYPAHLKKRIAGGFGHLSNKVAKDFLKKLINPKLKFVLAAHLSETNNSENLVRGLLSEILDEREIAYAIANQHDGSDWIEIS